MMHSHGLTRSYLGLPTCSKTCKACKAVNIFLWVLILLGVVGTIGLFTVAALWEGHAGVAAEEWRWQHRH